MISTLSRHALAFSLVLLTTGCLSFLSNNSATLIVGTWESKIGGFSVQLKYSETTVKIPGHDEKPYVIEDNHIVLDGRHDEARAISFPSRDQMLQTDPITGTEHRYSRIN